MSETYTRLEILRWMLENPEVNVAEYPSGGYADTRVHYRVDKEGRIQWKVMTSSADFWDSRNIGTSPLFDDIHNGGWDKVLPKKTREECLAELSRKYRLGYDAAAAFAEVFDLCMSYERGAK